MFSILDGRPLPSAPPYPISTSQNGKHSVLQPILPEGTPSGRHASSSTSTTEAKASQDGKDASLSRPALRQNSEHADDVDDEGDGEEPKTKPKKRRRVVAACTTCRRKKIKCEGLPNPTNTCFNCENMGYTCTFTLESDRSRGRFEIVESQRDTLLAALRSVAPELADQFQRGELHIISPSGTTGANGKANAHHTHAQPHTASQSFDSQLSHIDVTKRETDPMMPDMEDGRPRFFGGSSALHNFNQIQSRPTSPLLNGRRNTASTSQLQAPSAAAAFTTEGSSMQSEQHRRSKDAHGVNHSVLPMPMPQYPRNSTEWVRELRRQTLVAVGRDEIFADEGWFNRFPLPSADLLNEMLDFYFYRLNPILPILHEYTLRRDLAMGRAERDSAFRGLIFTIITIASRFHPRDPRVWADPSNPDSVGDHWAAASRFHHQVYAASLINVQVSLLSCAFMPAHLGIGTSWTVLGVAVRALFDVGGHADKAYVGYTPFEQERRRRTFWAAFCLDSILSINMGRPLGIRPSDISVGFPLLATEAALTEAERTGGPIEELHPRDTTPCEAAGFIHLIKICTLVRDTLLTIYRPATAPANAFPASSSTAQRANPRYKDMTILCKRLDEWTAEIPPFLQDIPTSSFPLQAALIQCGRNNVRLYILKPFLYDDIRASLQPGSHVTFNSLHHEDSENSSILRRMLLPQCTRHARGTLTAVMTLQERVGVPVIFFLLHQSFCSASTFILTIWHGTRDMELLRADSQLIEFSLRMYNGQSKYASVLLQRAHRILQNVAARTLTILTDEGQRKRMQEALHQSGYVMGGTHLPTASPLDGTPVRPSTNNVTGSSSAREQLSGAGGMAEAHGLHMPTAYHVQSSKVPLHNTTLGGNTTLFASGRSGKESNNSSTGASPLPMNFGGSTTPTNVGTGFSAFGLDQQQQQQPQLDAFDVQQWLPTPEGTPALMQADIDTVSSGHRFSGDLSWMDYFSRYIGGFLPEPQTSRDGTTGFCSSSSAVTGIVGSTNTPLGFTPDA